MCCRARQGKDSDILRTFWKCSLVPHISAVMDCIPPWRASHASWTSLHDDALGTYDVEAVIHCFKVQHEQYVR